VDRVFWLWQKRHGATDSQYPGTNSIDNQGPTPGVFPNSWLTMDSPLDPFRKADGTAYTSRDCFNIETQLGYTYGRGSLEDQAAMPMAAVAAAPVQRVHVAGINRGAIRGSFLVSAFAEIDGRMQHVGTEAVPSRWHVEGCANCRLTWRPGPISPFWSPYLALLQISRRQMSAPSKSRFAPATACWTRNRCLPPRSDRPPGKRRSGSSCANALRRRRRPLRRGLRIGTPSDARQKEQQIADRNPRLPGG
jgi:hypothetical protein